jgi:hypothetical protein
LRLRPPDGASWKATSDAVRFQTEDGRHWSQLRLPVERRTTGATPLLDYLDIHAAKACTGVSLH